MSKSWVCVKKCPACGGSLVVSFHYSFSRDYTITSKGVLSKRHSGRSKAPLTALLRPVLTAVLSGRKMK